MHMSLLPVIQFHDQQGQGVDFVLFVLTKLWFRINNNFFIDTLQ